MNSRFHLHKFTILTSRIPVFNIRNSRIHDFSFMNSRFQRCEWKKCIPSENYYNIISVSRNINFPPLLVAKYKASESNLYGILCCSSLRPCILLRAAVENWYCETEGLARYQFSNVASRKIHSLRKLLQHNFPFIMYLFVLFRKWNVVVKKLILAKTATPLIILVPVSKCNVIQI
jgi:hypothetical protein